MKSQWTVLKSLVMVAFLTLTVSLAQAQRLTTLSFSPQGEDGAGTQTVLSTAFTYQGHLKKEGKPINGTCDLQFSLWNAATGGTQVGTLQTKTNVTVSNGNFTIPDLDFGAGAFQGDARWLQIAVKCAGDVDYVTLAPRQPLTPTPYALFSKAAPWSGLSGMPAGFADNIDNDTLGSLSCGNGLVAKWNGAAWTCAADNDTTYTAGTGLTLSGNTFSLNPTYRLPQTCSNGQIAAWDTTASIWLCTNAASGDITAVNAGTGLTGGGTSGDVTLSADTAYLQRRVLGTCAAGNAIRVINADGTVTCEADDDTTYTAGDGLELSGTQFRMKGTSYQNVVIVAKSGGDFTSIQAALDSITDAGTDNRYLVWVAPGTYNERVTMKPYVDIEGAGELVTKITYSGSTALNTGTVIGANDAELRHLTVENTGAAAYAIAIYNASASPRLTQITLIVQGGTFNFGIYNYSSATPKLTNVIVTATGGNYTYGMYNSSSSPVLVNVEINATGATNNRGLYNDSGAPTLTNVTIEAGGGTDSRGVYNFNASPGIYSSVIKATTGSNTYGIYNYTTSIASSILINNSQINGSHYGLYSTAFGSYTSTVLVNNSQVSGSTHTIYNGTNSVTRIGASQLSGGAVSVGGGTVTCAGVYDENYAFYASTCP